MTEAVRRPAAERGRAVGRIVVDGRADRRSSRATRWRSRSCAAGEVPGRGGTLCLAGDCGNCLAEVDGIALRPDVPDRGAAGLRVSRGIRPGRTRHSRGGRHGPDRGAAAGRRSSSTTSRSTSRSSAAGRRGRRPRPRTPNVPARRSASSTPSAGDEVVAIYAGPTIVVRTPDGMLHVQPHEIVVATGAAEIHPVCPGQPASPGSVTARAAERLHAAGVDLGGGRRRTPPSGVACRSTAPGPLRGRRRGPRAAPSSPRTRRPASRRPRPADTVVVGLGLAPRDVLARMAGDGPGHASSATRPTTQPLPPPPTEGVVCGCMGTTVADLDGRLGPRLHRARAPQALRAWPCLGTCQGGACLPHVRSWIAARTGDVPEPFTARARRPARSPRRGRRRHHDRRLPADAAPRRAPRRSAPGWTGSAAGGGRGTTATPSPSTGRSARASRSATSSTLGKLVVVGPDVVELLERLYPCHVADIKPGRSRYALLLNERGHVMDDGMILRDSETRFVLSFTSRRRGQRRDVDPRLDRRLGPPRPRPRPDDVARRDQRHGAARRRRCCAALGLADPPRFLGHVRADVAGVPCHVMRLSFTGEAAFELHHPVDRSVELWRALIDLRRGPRHPAARAPGAVRAAAREGPRHRRHGHRARHDAAPARDGLGGPDGEAAVHRPGVARADREARRTTAAGSGFTMDGAGAGRGLADLVRAARSSAT